MTMTTTPQSLADIDAERDPDDGEITVTWKRGADTISLICHPTGTLTRVVSPAREDEPVVRSHVLALRSRDSVEPIATVINNNQPGWTNIIETAPNVTLGVGTKLYLAPQRDPLNGCAEYTPVKISAQTGPAARAATRAEEIGGYLATIADLSKRLETAEAALSSHAEKAESFDLIAYLGRQWPWSKKTFGPGDRTAGVLDHIRKELTEIEADPDDLSEWVDVVILAMDGVWRRGFTAEQFCAALQAKQNKNFARQWPDWRTQPTDKAIEHVRTESPAMIKAAKGGEI